MKRLDVDHIDLYYLHHRSEDTPIEESVTAMATLREAGKSGRWDCPT
ncbi:MAG: aldo/keto reductase [Rhodococcus sp. (in: high G+C Gram-positive bacteria)]